LCLPHFIYAAVFAHNYVIHCKPKRFLPVIGSLVEAVVFEIDTRIGNPEGVNNIALMPVLQPLPWR